MRRTKLARIVLPLAAILGSPAHARDADACGTFFASAAERRPSLSYEQTLVIYDRPARREHFVRAVVFRESQEPFGFVVPTPSRPDVASVATNPFAKLESSFPFAPRPVAKGGGGGSGGVTVLDVENVGSFKAFVLAARDESSLSSWLAKNGFTSTPEADAWLAHYVALGFYYVAMRYDPPEHAPEQTASEVVRFSFDSPAPYYPYLEPHRREPPSAPRMLDVWLVSDAEWIPVAAHATGSEVSWVRPLLPGPSYGTSITRTQLSAALGPDANLLPAGALVVQRFADEKKTREGFGDIVFVPAKPDESPDEATLARFVPLVDPAVGMQP
jgi:hypothetical protein